MRDLIDISYNEHERYSQIPISEDIKSIAYKKFNDAFSQIWNAEKKLISKVAMQPEIKNVQNKNLLKKLNKNGIVKFSLAKQFTRELLTLSEPFVESLTAKRNEKKRELLGVEAASTLLGRIKSDESDYYCILRDELERQGIFEVASNYFGRQLKLKMVIMQKNSDNDSGIKSVCAFDDGSRSDCYYMHIDSSVQTLKMIIYLTPTTRSNGAFRYIPQSHKWISPLEACIRRANDMAGLDSLDDKAMHLFRNLPPAIQKKANFGNDLIGSQGKNAASLLQLENIYEGKPGEGIIFDNSGVHRGAIFEEPGERVILQLLLV